MFGISSSTYVNIVSQNTEAFQKPKKSIWTGTRHQLCRFIDPQKYVFFPTSKGGLISLSDKIDIKGFLLKDASQGRKRQHEVKHVGGMLNDVYLIDAHGTDGETKVLAKRFKDWSGFKWFPLTLWSFGARSFAVSGQARLAKEYAISEFLRNEGFNVPKILHVSNAERMVFMEFIEGENLSEAIKRAATSTEPSNPRGCARQSIAESAKFARVHSRDVALGDTKPDNELVKSGWHRYFPNRF